MPVGTWKIIRSTLVSRLVYSPSLIVSLKENRPDQCGNVPSVTQIILSNDNPFWNAIDLFIAGLEKE